jgi:uncharacterized protein YbjT (DUF2867 family)
MILVTGASGTTGRAMAGALADRAPARLAARRPERVRPSPSQDAVRFDFAAPETFGPALDGVEAVFLLRPPQMAKARDFDPFLEAVRAARVRRVVFLSVKGAERNPLLPHHALERRLARFDLPHTNLRPNDFMQNFATVHAGTIRETGEIRLPAGDGRASWVDVRDVAEAAAVALLDATPGNRAHTLTGPRAVSCAEVAEAIAAAVGHPVRYRPVSLPRFVVERRRAGAPTALALVMSAIYTIQRLGLAAEVTDDLPRLLGRAPRDIAAFARDYRDAWAAREADPARGAFTP